MANYKNQRTVYLSEVLGEIQHTKKDEGNETQFLVALEWEPLLNVMSDLTPSEFYLWLYILKYRGKRKDTGLRYYEFSPADLEDRFGWKDDTSRKHFKSLITKGYLVQEGTNRYSFVPYPEEVCGRAALTREKNRDKRLNRANK